MTPDQLRKALTTDLNGQRDCVLFVRGVEKCIVQNAMLIPAEDDRLLKLTDGKHTYIVDAEQVVWVKVG